MSKDLLLWAHSYTARERRALHAHCPFCGAKPGEECSRMARGRSLRGEHVYPHRPRMQAAAAIARAT